MIEYPKREQVFALKYIQWLIDTEATVEAGPDAFALLVAVAIAEDRIRYSRAPNFFNDQICRHCGIASIPALIRARNRAIECGLLEYVPGAKRRPGTYFVTGFSNDSLQKAEGKRKESEKKAPPSNPIPIPNPSNVASLFSSVTFEDFWKEFPRRNGKLLGKEDTRAAFAKINPAEHVDLMRAVKSYANSEQLKKDPARFLAKNYWRDWIPTTDTAEKPQRRFGAPA